MRTSVHICRATISMSLIYLSLGSCTSGVAYKCIKERNARVCAHSTFVGASPADMYINQALRVRVHEIQQVGLEFHVVA